MRFDCVPFRHFLWFSFKTRPGCRCRPGFPLLRCCTLCASGRGEEISWFHGCFAHPVLGRDHGIPMLRCCTLREGTRGRDQSVSLVFYAPCEFLRWDHVLFYYVRELAGGGDQSVSRVFCAPCTTVGSRVSPGARVDRRRSVGFTGVLRPLFSATVTV